jgi:hypothetical protein
MIPILYAQHAAVIEATPTVTALPEVVLRLPAASVAVTLHAASPCVSAC